MLGFWRDPFFATTTEFPTARTSLVPSLFGSPLLPRRREWLDFPHAPRVTENDKEYTVAFDLPRYEDKDTTVEVKGNMLHVTATHKCRSEDGHSQSSESMSESFRLPRGLDTKAMTKKLTNGVLTITLPKTEEARAAAAAAAAAAEAPTPAQPEPKWYDSWPPKVQVQKSSEGNELMYTFALPGAAKENIRLAVRNDTMYLTVVEPCNLCQNEARCKEQLEKAWADVEAASGSGSNMEDRLRAVKLAEAELETARHRQCVDHCELTTAIAVPHGTRGSDLNAKYEGGQLAVRCPLHVHGHQVAIA